MGITQLTIPGIGKRPFTLFSDQSIKPAVLLRRMADFGYEKVGRLARPGEFRALGDVIDIFPLLSQQPFRIEFWGNQIEAITELAIETDETFEERLSKKLSQSFLNTIEPGDYIVHLDHGIGRFKEMRIIDYESYFLLEYAGGDKLFVPQKMRKKLSPYIGFGIPRLSRLKGSSWLATKRRVNEETKKLARELLSLYAKRAIAYRPSYRHDASLEEEFSHHSALSLTQDQIAAIRDITQDLQKKVPMDRLICGDVGFGKTEVALRCAFTVISNNKQVVLLTPTTILADQHYQYVTARFEPFGIRIALLSRGSQNIAPHALATYDMLVGTHKVFSSIEHLPRLGLVIIDEEQKFGVKQKEKFKSLREHIDMLSLSATPIPRTFQLVLAGMRDISNIITPLPGKEPILTYIHEYSELIIKEAALPELNRKGQIYYLVPRINDIPRARLVLETLFPSARIAMAHGKMPEHTLIDTIHAFRNKEFDILIATTIIENGLDLENVNTIIVQDAQKLGLAQAHQIRGRVGRRSTQAQAYFLYNKREITEDGRKRLKMLRRFQGLGQNYELALKDLEIRGAGNILGKEQSGNITAVGLHLYSEMLKEAVTQLKATME